LEDFTLPYGSTKIGRPLVSLNLPNDSLIALIGWGDNFLVPDGGTRLGAGDGLWVLVGDTSLPYVRDVLTESNRASV
jgi:cell volume regulation protein A